MNFRVLEGPLAPAEGETTVRSYHSTSLSSGLLGLKAEGYLAVTNLRVIFYATGKSFVGKSILQSEVPLADVSGISSYKGAHFNIFDIVIAWFVSSAIALFGGSILGLVISLIGRLIESVQLVQIIQLILGAVLVLASLSVPTEKLRRPILAALGAWLLFTVGGLGFAAPIFGRQSDFGASITSGLSTVGGFIGFLAGLYALACNVLYARRPTMSLAIGSKGGSSTPISISGLSGFGLFSGTALRALSAEPAEDVEPMIKELGAMIYDLQVMGADGVRKWGAS